MNATAIHVVPSDGVPHLSTHSYMCHSKLMGHQRYLEHYETPLQLRVLKSVGGRVADTCVWSIPSYRGLIYNYSQWPGLCKLGPLTVVYTAVLISQPGKATLLCHIPPGWQDGTSRYTQCSLLLYVSLCLSEVCSNIGYRYQRQFIRRLWKNRIRNI